MNKANAGLLCCAVSALLPWGEAAYAQQAERGRSDLEDIIVTAQRVQQRQQDVPVAITTVTPQVIAEASINDAFDLQRVVPALTVSRGAFGGDANPGYTIRGLGNSILADPGVVIYFDEVPIEQRFYPYNYYDLGNIQALKGPQGTLFGKNSTGGAILFTPQHPTDRFEGYIEGQIGNMNLRRLEGAINIPVADVLKLRFSGQREVRDGFVKSATAPGVDFGDRDNWSIRAQATLTPADNIEIYTSYMHNAVHQSANAFIMTQIASCPNPNPAVAACTLAPPLPLPPTQGAGPFVDIRDEFALQQSLGIRRTIQDARNPFDVNTDAVTNIITLDFDQITIKNIAHIEWAHAFNGLDSDSNRNFTEQNVINYDYKTTSNELQFIGNLLDGRLKFIAGGFYSHVRQKERYDSYSFVLPVSTTGRKIQTVDQTFESKALFASVTGDLSDLVPGLSLTAGYRYTWDDKDYHRTAFQATGPGTAPITCALQSFVTINNFFQVPVPGSHFANVDPTSCTMHLRRKFKEGGYTLTADWKVTDNTLLYVTRRKGYKAGGFNFTALNPANIPYQPETATDVEVGFKGDFDIGGIGLRANAAAFRTSFKSIQIGRIVVTGGIPEQTIVNTNTDGTPNKARLQGYELELTVVPTPGMTISGFYSHVEAEYRNYRTDALDLRGDNIAGVIPKTFGIRTHFAAPAQSWGAPALSINYSHQAAPLVNALSSPLAWMSATKSVDARFSVDRVADLPLELAVWGSNLTNEKSPSVNNQFAALTVGRTQFREPRTYGLSLRYRFGE